MHSRKLYLFVLIALLNSCAPTANQVTPSVIPLDSNNNSISQSSSSNNKSSDIPVNTISPSPLITSENKTYSLSAEEIKKIADSSIVKANNNLGLKVFLEIVKNQKNENVFISPASIALALQMAYNGADSSTKEEMSKVLDLNNLSLEEVNKLSNLLIKKLNNPTNDIELKVANSIWTDSKRVRFFDDFKNNLVNSYDAEAKELNFSDKGSVKLINKWVSDKTNKKIQTVIDDIDEKTIAYLINAIYFKADWTEKFDASETMEKDFTLYNGTKKQHSMMSDFREFRYFSNTNSYPEWEGIKPEQWFEGAELTYGKDKKVSLFIFLPNKQSSLEKFYSQLNNENLDKWLNSFYYGGGLISLPKFKNEWNTNLKTSLNSLGMVQAFKELDADFSKMGKTYPTGIISLDKIIHKTYVDINEDGAEAAAVTVVQTINTQVSSEPTTSAIRFVADRPFFYLIRDNETKSILFMGAVNNPEYQ